MHNDLIKTERVLEALWRFWTQEDPDSFRADYWPAGVAPQEPIERAVADFISMMTDRYALRLHEELLLPSRWPVL